MLQIELEAAKRGAMSSPSRSIASSLAESDCIPAFNPPSGAMPPSGAAKRPGMSLLNFKGLSDSPGPSPASASKVAGPPPSTAVKFTLVRLFLFTLVD